MSERLRGVARRTRDAASLSGTGPTTAQGVVDRRFRIEVTLPYRLVFLANGPRVIPKD